MRALSTVLVLVISAAALSACLPGQNPQEEPAPAMMEEKSDDAMMEESSMEDTESMEAHESAMENSVMPENGRVEMVASNFKYDVTEIRAKAGEPLTIAVTNDEGFHDLVIDELEVNSGMIPAGETMELKIPTDKPGTYEFYCSVGEHRAMGMKGMLIVE